MIGDCLRVIVSELGDIERMGYGHGRRGALKLATSTKDFKTESESRPTYIQGEI